ncbi:MAG: T9SS type A sorting domain-containing protein [Bacteroidetes bacterium]|nr:T9SS type A sorting domain-containing protein [Bacteroidota bacterium]
MSKKVTIILSLLWAIPLLTTWAQQQDVFPIETENPAVYFGESAGDTPDGELGQWASVAPLPSPKTYHTVAAANGMLYVFGGVNAANQFDQKSYKYDPGTDTWAAIADFPIQRFLYGRAETVGDKIYIFGGVENFGQNYQATTAIVEYNPTTDSYTQKTPMSVAQGMPGSAQINGKIYVIGGNGATEAVYLRTVQVYDPASDSWSTATDYPRDVKWMGAVSIGDKIVCTGGFNVNYTPSRYIADTYVGELQGDDLVWTKVSDAAIGPVIFPVAGSHNGIAYFSGGRPAADDNAPATQRGYTYDETSDTWTVLEPKPIGIQYITQAPLIGNRLYFAAGTLASGAATAEVQYYDAEAEAKPMVVISATGMERWVTRSSTYRYSFTLRNMGGLDLEWSAGSDTDWLSVDDPGSGTLAPGEQGAVTFTVTPNALAEGQYQGDIIITTNDADNEELRFSVAIVVQEAPVDEELNVLIEQYTGTWCIWCPYGADSLAVVAARHGSRAVRLAWHDDDPMEIPAWNDMKSWMGVRSYPSASINRIQWPGEAAIPIGRGNWGERTGYLLRNQRSPVGITISDKSYDPVTKNYSFKATVFFHQSIHAELRLNAVMTEDGFDHPQKRINMSTGRTETISPYIHKSVVTGIWPNIQGYGLFPGNSFETQTSTEQEFTFTSSHENDEFAWINVIVHSIVDGEPGPVLQSVSEPAFFGVTDVQALPAVTTFALRQNYPNPFNPTTNVTFDVPHSEHVRIALYDGLGRFLGHVVDEGYHAGTHTVVFDGGNLHSGTYYLTMRAGDFVQTRALTLVK